MELRKIDEIQADSFLILDAIDKNVFCDDDGEPLRFNDITSARNFLFTLGFKYDHIDSSILIIPITKKIL